MDYNHESARWAVKGVLHQLLLASGLWTTALLCEQNEIKTELHTEKYPSWKGNRKSARYSHFRLIERLGARWRCDGWGADFHAASRHFCSVLYSNNKYCINRCLRSLAYLHSITHAIDAKLFSPVSFHVHAEYTSIFSLLLAILLYFVWLLGAFSVFLFLFCRLGIHDGDNSTIRHVVSKFILKFPVIVVVYIFYMTATHHRYISYWMLDKFFSAATKPDLTYFTLFHGRTPPSLKACFFLLPSHINLYAILRLLILVFIPFLSSLRNFAFLHQIATNC